MWSRCEAGQGILDARTLQDRINHLGYEIRLVSVR